MSDTSRKGIAHWIPLVSGFQRTYRCWLRTPRRQCTPNHVS